MRENIVLLQPWAPLRMRSQISADIDWLDLRASRVINSPVKQVRTEPPPPPLHRATRSHLPTSFHTAMSLVPIGWRATEALSFIWTRWTRRCLPFRSISSLGHRRRGELSNLVGIGVLKKIFSHLASANSEWLWDYLCQRVLTKKSVWVVCLRFAATLHDIWQCEDFMKTLVYPWVTVVLWCLYYRNPVLHTTIVTGSP